MFNDRNAPRTVTFGAPPPDEAQYRSARLGSGAVAWTLGLSSIALTGIVALWGLNFAMGLASTWGEAAKLGVIALAFTLCLTGLPISSALLSRSYPAIAKQAMQLWAGAMVLASLGALVFVISLSPIASPGEPAIEASVAPPGAAPARSDVSRDWPCGRYPGAPFGALDPWEECPDAPPVPRAGKRGETVIAKDDRGPGSSRVGPNGRRLREDPEGERALDMFSGWNIKTGFREVVSVDSAAGDGAGRQALVMVLVLAAIAGAGLLGRMSVLAMSESYRLGFGEASPLPVGGLPAPRAPAAMGEGMDALAPAEQFALWANSALVPAPGAVLPFSDAYTHYRNACQWEGLNPLNETAFGTLLTKRAQVDPRGIVKTKSGGVMVYQGWRLPEGAFAREGGDAPRGGSNTIRTEVSQPFRRD